MRHLELVKFPALVGQYPHSKSYLTLRTYPSKEKPYLVISLLSGRSGMRLRCQTCMLLRTHQPQIRLLNTSMVMAVELLPNKEGRAVSTSAGMNGVNKTTSGVNGTTSGGGTQSHPAEEEQFPFF